MPMIPMDTALSPVGVESFQEEILRALVRLQGEGGYASDDDSKRVRELLAWALILGIDAATVYAIGSNIFPQDAEELLTDHERAVRALNDVARTNEERQIRLVEHRSSERNGTAYDLTEILTRAGVTNYVYLPPRQTVIDSGAEDASVFQGAILLSSWSSRIRQIATAILRTQLPAWRFGQLRHHTVDELLITDTEATWDNGVSIVGQAGLQAYGNGFTQPRPVARVKSYGPASRLTARDLNAIQDNAFIAPASDTANEALASALADGRVFFFTGRVTAGGGTTQLVSGFDARQRYIQVVVGFSGSGGEIRPGNVGDTGHNLATFESFIWATRTGVPSRTLTGSGAHWFTATSTEIGMANSAVPTFGADRTYVGALICTPKIDTGDRSQRLATFVDDETGPLDASMYDALVAAGMGAPANGAGTDAWSGYPTSARGTIGRVGVIARTSRPGVGATDYVLDTSIDWRDRLLLVSPVVTAYAGTDPRFPGVSGDDLYSAGAIRKVVYTGTGISAGSDVLSAYEYAIGPSSEVRISVRSTDGALMVQHHASSSAASALVMLSIVATDQLGERSAATPTAAPVAPGTGDYILPEQLNWIQDGILLAQTQAAPGTSIETMPLGPVRRGHTNTPVAWQTTLRRGRANDYVGVELRQPVAGRIRRYLSCPMPQGTTVTIDALNDWRDRVLNACVVYSTSDITPGGANESLINGVAGVTHAERQWYSGPGGGDTGNAYALQLVGGGGGQIGLAIRVNSNTGALEMVNINSGSTYYIVAMIEGTFAIGPRSVA